MAAVGYLLTYLLVQMYILYVFLSREIALTAGTKGWSSLSGGFILLYKLRMKRQKLKMRDVSVYLRRRGRMWC